MIQIKYQNLINLEENMKKWKEFNQKHEFNSKYETHSNLVVIGKVYKHPEQSLFRAHVFNNRLIKYNPYFNIIKYHNPIWHFNHYSMCMEQMYHAGTSLIRDNITLATKEYSVQIELRKEALFKSNISIEMYLEEKRKTSQYILEELQFNFYDEKNEEIIAQMNAKTLVTKRAYAKDIEAIKEGDITKIPALIDKITKRQVNLDRLTVPRKDLKITKDELITHISKGQIPIEIYDFFSYWDREQAKLL